MASDFKDEIKSLIIQILCHDSDPRKKLFHVRSWQVGSKGDCDDLYPRNLSIAKFTNFSMIRINNTVTFALSIGFDAINVVKQEYPEW